MLCKLRGAGLFAAGLILGWTTLQANDSDWPHWRGNDRNSTVTAAGMKFDEGYGLKVAWKKNIGSAYSSISVVGKRAVTMGCDDVSDYVICLDAETGKELWRYKIGPTYKGHDGSHDGPNSTPLIDAGSVYGLGPNGHLFALSLNNGKPHWAKQIVESDGAVIPFHGFTTAPLVAGKVLVVEVGGENHMVAGYDKKSGQRLWTAAVGKVDYQSPTIGKIAGKLQVVCASNNNIYGLDPANGQKLWEYKHEGNAGSSNPLILDGDRLFFSIGRPGYMLARLEKKDEGYALVEQWQTRQYARSFCDPVYHKGYFYGYTGRFITCINAENGEQVWKSRPPGDGFLILVDDYLVVQTKQGTLHVARANPQDYTEVASIELFDSISWTPPSYAAGRIFTRNLTDVAALDIAQVDQQFVAVEDAGPALKAPASKFARFVAEVETASDKKVRIDRFIAAQKSFPVIEDEQYAHIVFRGEAKDLVLVGDMLETNTQVPMHHIEGTDFFYASFELPGDARLNYNFIKDFDNRITDPRNQNVVSSVFGDASQLAMSRWRAPAHLEEPGGPRGKIETLEFDSKELGKRTLQVYLPPGYAQGEARYPVIYVTSGDLAIQHAKMNNSLDNLIGKRVEPVVAVFMHAPNSFREFARAQKDQHAAMVSGEIVPLIDSRFRTRAEAAARAIVGGDEGGFASLYTALKHPNTFSMVAGQSTHMLRNAGGDEMIALIESAPQQSLRIYLDWGRFDYRNTAGGYNWADLGKDLADRLKARGYGVSGGQHNESWGYASWRNRTDVILAEFFPISSR